MDWKEQDLCPMGVKNETEINNLKENVNVLFDKLDMILKKLDKMQADFSNRLPVWASLGFTFLGGLVGFFASACLHLLK